MIPIEIWDIWSIPLGELSRGPFLETVLYVCILPSASYSDFHYIHSHFNRTTFVLCSTLVHLNLLYSRLQFKLILPTSLPVSSLSLPVILSHHISRIEMLWHILRALGSLCGKVHLLCLCITRHTNKTFPTELNESVIDIRWQDETENCFEDCRW